MPFGGVRVEGLNEFLRVARASEKRVRSDVRAGLREAAEPVRSRAQSLAASNISRLGPRWGAMKVGVTLNYVYVAPAARRAGGSPRPNLGGLLMQKAMSPALDEKRGEVEDRLEKVLDDIGRDW